MADVFCTVGDLRTLITFQEPTIAQDTGGAQVATYADIATNPTVWARWVNDHGQELVQSGADVSVQRATVTVRNRGDLLETWRVLKDGVAWKIITPPDHVRDFNRWTEFRVELVKGTV